MKRLFLLSLIFISIIEAKYLDSKSCAECHEMIHYEHTMSMHHNSSIFKDEFHAKIKQINTPDKYDCALCHTPAAKNLRALMKGEEQPSKTKEELDGVSCFYCHQINKVLITKHKNINFYGYKGDLKSTFYGNLDNPDTSDKHKSDSTNKIYKNSQVCMGCHGKKFNKYKVQICSGVDEKGETSDCIGCHMPKIPGGTTKLNKRGRSEYASHEFLGIRSEKMVKKAVELELNQIDGGIELMIKNKMGHSIIMQPMRLKYVHTEVFRSGKRIWKNFDKFPIEDKEVAFTVLFKDDKGKQVFPPFAQDYKYNMNLAANSSKKVVYKIPDLKKGDIVISKWISYIIRPALARVLKLEDKEITKKYIGATAKITIK